MRAAPATYSYQPKDLCLGDSPDAMTSILGKRLPRSLNPFRGTVQAFRSAISFAAIADLAYHGANLPKDASFTPGLEATSFYDPPDSNDPQAMHLAVVEVDADTGVVDIKQYFTSDDCGVLINPMIVEGQVHGGLAQGIGQAMMVNIVYEADSGQLITGSFMDYAMSDARRSAATSISAT